MANKIKNRTAQQAQRLAEKIANEAKREAKGAEQHKKLVSSKALERARKRRLKQKQWLDKRISTFKEKTGARNITKAQMQLLKNKKYTANQISSYYNRAYTSKWKSEYKRKVLEFEEIASKKTHTDYKATAEQLEDLKFLSANKVAALNDLKPEYDLDARMPDFGTHEYIWGGGDPYNHYEKTVSDDAQSSDDILNYQFIEGYYEHSDTNKMMYLIGISDFNKYGWQQHIVSYFNHGFIQNPWGLGDNVFLRREDFYRMTHNLKINGFEPDFEVDFDNRWIYWTGKEKGKD